MAAPEPRIFIGNWDNPRCVAKKVTQRYGELDAAALTFVSKEEEPFTEGGPVPDMPGFVFDSIDNTHRGGAYVHECAAVGIVGAKRVKGFPQIADKSDGWDTVVDEWYSTSPTYFRKGVFGNYGGTTICMDASSSPVIGGIHRVRGNFIGIITPKTYSRSVTCNGQSFSGNYFVNLENGWAQPRPSQIDLPKLLVTDTYFTTTRPQTSNIPGNMTPPNAPAVRVISFTGEVLAHWPSGWSLTVAYRQLPGVTLYEVDYIYEFKLKFTPGG